VATLRGSTAGSCNGVNRP